MQQQEQLEQKQQLKQRQHQRTGDVEEGDPGPERLRVWWQERNLQNYHATRLKLQKFFIIHFVAAVESSSE